MALRDSFKISNWVGATVPQQESNVVPAKGATSSDSGGSTGETFPNNSQSSNQKSFKKQVLYSWQAPSRVQGSSTNLRLTRSLIIIAIIVALLLIAMQEFLLVLAIASIIFIRYALASTPAEMVTHEITNLGFSYAGDFTEWKEFKQFYLDQQEGNAVLVLELKQGLSRRLFAIIPDAEQDKIQDMVNEYLPFLEEAPKSSMDKAYNQIRDKLIVSEDDASASKAL